MVMVLINLKMGFLVVGINNLYQNKKQGKQEDLKEFLQNSLTLKFNYFKLNESTRNYLRSTF